VLNREWSGLRGLLEGMVQVSRSGSTAPPPVASPAVAERRAA
jgi:hypothetical protein